MDLIML